MNLVKECRQLFSKENKGNLFLCVISLMILFIINWVWFWPLKEKIFLMGDDIRFYNIVKSSDNILRTVLTNEAGVYRPVSYLVMAIAVKILGTNSLAYFKLNLIFNMLIIYSVYYFIYKIAQKGKLLFSFFGSYIYIIAVYSYYGITQLLGLMEQMCVFFCIWFLYFIFQYIKHNRTKDYMYSVFIYLLVMLTHERFLALLGVYIVLNLFILYDRHIKSRIKNLMVASLPAIYFIVMKVFILKTMLFKGTAQIPIELSFPVLMGHIVKTILSMFGINVGPNYLMGHLFIQYSKIQQFMILLAAILLLVAFSVYVYQCIIKDKQNAKQEMQKLLAFIFTEGAVIICYSVSTRIEMRQIYVPYILFIIYAVYCISKLNVPSIALSISALYSVIVISMNSYIFSQNIDSLFFIRTMNMAKTGYENTIAMNKDIEDYKVYIEENDELTWAMLLSDEKDIFYMYDKKVAWERFADIEVLQEEVKKNLEEGKKVKVLYLSKDTQMASLEYIDMQQKINIKEQMGR